MEENIQAQFRVISTDQFQKWLNSFKKKDFEVVRRVAARQLAMTQGHFGHTRSLGEGVSETKIDFGPGYRIYYTIRKSVVVILLAGGSKKTQQGDIDMAKRLAKDLPEEFI